MGGVAAGADEETAVALCDLELRSRVGLEVLVALGAGVQRVVVEVEPVREGDVARVDAALHGLEVVGELATLRDEALLRVQSHPFQVPLDDSRNASAIPSAMIGELPGEVLRSPKTMTGS